MKTKCLISFLMLSSFSVSACAQVKTAKAEAKIEINEQTSRYKLTQMKVKGGDASFPRRMANSVIESLNKHIDDVYENTRGLSDPEILNAKANTQYFGHDKKQTYIIQPDGKKVTTSSGDKATALGVMHGKRNLQIVGGNIYLKRAALRSKHKDLKRYNLALLAAKDHEKYLKNKKTIDAALNHSPKSGPGVSNFARGWRFTLEQNTKNGIEKSSVSDFYGGPKGFFQSVLRLSDKRASFEEISINLKGDDLEVITEIKKNRNNSKARSGLLFTETNFLKPLDHPEGGAGYKQSQESNYLHFIGPDLDDSKITHDIFIGSAEADTINGGIGRDWLDGGGGANHLSGGSGHDVLLGRAGDDHLRGDDGDDIIYSGGGADTIYAGRGNDEIHSSAKEGNITAYGEAGDDLFIVKFNKNRPSTHYQLYGGAGTDTLSFEDNYDSIDLAFNGTKQTFNYNNLKIDIEAFENFTGSQFGDTLTGDVQDNKIIGSGGDDTIDGKDGDDVIVGSRGSDKLTGGKGKDTVSYETSSGGVDVSLVIDKTHAFGGDASGDSYEDIFENLTGSPAADVLEGNELNNIITSLTGDDYILATNGADSYFGGDGFDSVDYGNHTGGTGLTLNVERGIKGYTDSDSPSMGTHRLSGIEHIVGTVWDDTIKFGDGDDVLEGGKGNDKLYGGKGDDTYFVEYDGGHDEIFENGAEGRDKIMIGSHRDLNWNDIDLSISEEAFTVKLKDQTLASIKNGPFKGRKFSELGIEVIDFAGSGEIEIDTLEAEHSGSEPTNSDDVVVGHDNTSNLLLGYDGDDILIGAADRDKITDKGNLFLGGRGDDQIFAGDGNDIYIFDVGSGADTITDTGGIDHLYFGPAITEDDLLFETKGRDVYYGLKPKGSRYSKDLKASEVEDRIHFINKKGQPYNYIEFYTIDNKTVDIRKVINKRLGL